jgi:hypothetical protein
MTAYIGDFAEDATVIHYFNTFSSNDPAASVTVSTLLLSDLYVYKDGSVTDIVTDGATVDIDFDGRVGVHKLTIDTSVDAAYSTGSDYMVLIEGATVDAANITAAILTFSIENRYNSAAAVADQLNLGIIYSSFATGSLSATSCTTNLSGYADNQLIGRVLVVTSGAAEGEATDITDYANTNGVLTITALTTTPANTDTFKIV